MDDKFYAAVGVAIILGAIWWVLSRVFHHGRLQGMKNVGLVVISKKELDDLIADELWQFHSTLGLWTQGFPCAFAPKYRQLNGIPG